MLDLKSDMVPYEQMARLGKVLSGPLRIRIIHLLAQCERTVESLAQVLEEPVVTVSHHLQLLLGVKFLKKRKIGRHVVYALESVEVARFWLCFRAFCESQLAELQVLRQSLAHERNTGAAYEREALMREISAGEVVLLDVRPKPEYEAGHLPGAISLALDELPRRAKEIPRHKKVVLYCRGPYCRLADQARDYFNDLGIQTLRLDEGPLEWEASGFDVERDFPTCPINKKPLKSNNT